MVGVKEEEIDMPLTNKQKEIATRLASSFDGEQITTELRVNIRKEKEYSQKKEASQTPTRKQYHQAYNL